MQKKAMKTYLINPGKWNFLYSFRKFSEQGDSLLLVPKGLPSRQQDHLLDGVKGNVPACKFCGSASRWPPLQPLREDLSHPLPVCNRRVCSLALLLPWEMHSAAANAVALTQVLARGTRKAAFQPPPGSAFTAPSAADCTSRSYCPHCWKMLCSPCTAARADALPGWRARLPSQVSLPGKYTLIYIPPELVSSSLALNPS